MRLGGLRKWKIPVTPSGIEPTTFQLVAQCPNQLYHCTPIFFREGCYIYMCVCVCVCVCIYIYIYIYIYMLSSHFCAQQYVLKFNTFCFPQKLNAFLHFVCQSCVTVNVSRAKGKVLNVVDILLLLHHSTTHVPHSKYGFFHKRLSVEMTEVKMLNRGTWWQWWHGGTFGNRNRL